MDLFGFRLVLKVESFGSFGTRPRMNVIDAIFEGDTKQEYDCC